MISSEMFPCYARGAHKNLPKAAICPQAKHYEP